MRACAATQRRGGAAADRCGGGGGAPASYGRPGGAAGQDPDDKSYAIRHASTATKTDTPVMETPLNVQIGEPAGAERPPGSPSREALKNVSGVTFQENAGGGWRRAHVGYVVMRGFQTGATYRDGFRNNYGSGGDSGFVSLDFTNIDPDRGDEGLVGDPLWNDGAGRPSQYRHQASARYALRLGAAADWQLRILPHERRRDRTVRRRQELALSRELLL